jgi:hypothetical protein
MEPRDHEHGKDSLGEYKTETMLNSLIDLGIYEGRFVSHTLRSELGFVGQSMDVLDRWAEMIRDRVSIR